MFRLAMPWKLREFGVLGMNARNYDYVQAVNDPTSLLAVDDKTVTKRLAKKARIPVPKLEGIIEFQHQVRKVARLVADLPDFVVKPSQGSGGRGILVIRGRDGDNFVKASGEIITLEQVKRHVTTVLSGLFSLGGKPDKAIFERCINFNHDFDDFSYQGVPDVRIVVYMGYPVMAMMRLSTKESDGKANLHQGAVGVGISIRDGSVRSAVQKNRLVTQHPDTGATFDRLVIPQWDKHLEISARCFEMTGLGYFGGDIVLDAELGPMVLELNARPGLAIQTANQAGLVPRLEMIDTEYDPTELRTPSQRVAISKAWFD